jgi:uncharacterized DUF497 family protein
MKFDWDEAKRLSNLAKHGVDFADAAALDWDTAIAAEDTRKAYGETRWIAFGLLQGRLHCIAFTRRADTVRVISFRKAHWKEQRHYAENKKAR